MLTNGGLPAAWANAEQWARAIALLSGATIAVWAIVRWPLLVLLKAAALAALRVALADEDLRRAVGRMLREHPRDDVASHRHP